MKNPKIDLNDGDLIIGSGNVGFDSDGHMMVDVGSNMSIDMETGDVHITTGDDE